MEKSLDNHDMFGLINNLKEDSNFLSKEQRPDYSYLYSVLSTSSNNLKQVSLEDANLNPKEPPYMLIRNN